MLEGTFQKNKKNNTNKALAYSMTLSLGAKILNFGQAMVISFAFGTTESTDILFYSLSFVLLLTTFIGAINHQVIIPTSIELRENVSEQESKGFMSYIYILYFAIGLVVAIGLFFSPTSFIAILSRFPQVAIVSNINIIRLILPTLFLIILNTYILDIFTSYEYFTFPMLLDMLKNIIIVVFVLLLKDKFQVESLALGILFGNFAQFVVLNTLLFVKIRMRFILKRYRLSRSIKKNIFFVVTGRASTFLNDFIMISILSGFTAGVFSAMDYAARIETVLTMVIVGQISTVVGIKILQIYATKDLEGVKKILLKYLNIGLFIIVPISFIVSFNAKPIIQLLFQRGSFGKEATDITSMFLRYFILTVPLELINSFIVMLIIAKQIQHIAFKWQIFQSFMNIAIVWIAVSKFGYKGYPIAVVASFAIYILLISYFLVKSEFKFIGQATLLKPCFMNLFLNICVLFLMNLVFLKFDLGDGYIEQMLYILLSSLFYFAIFLIISYVTGLHRENIRAIFTVLRKRINRA